MFKNVHQSRPSKQIQHLHPKCQKARKLKFKIYINSELFEKSDIRDSKIVPNFSRKIPKTTKRNLKSIKAQKENNTQNMNIRDKFRQKVLKMHDK